MWQIKGYCSTDCGEENDDKDEEKAREAKARASAAAAIANAGDEDEEYYDYYDEEEEGAEGQEVPDLMVVGTGIAVSSSQEETKENVADPASTIAREREELKVPEEERKAIEQMSDIEKNIIAKQDKAAEVKKAEKSEADKDFSWWQHDDGQTYFCVSTKDQYEFKPGQQIFTSYGRRSNKFLLTFYGFCIADNRHDSVVMRIRRSIDSDSRLTVDGIVQMLVLSNEEIESGSHREIELEK